LTKYCSFQLYQRISLAACLTCVVSLANATPIVTPLGLNTGDSYRLAFITSEMMRAENNDIEFYNQFVTDSANNVTFISALATTWHAIVSTETVDARDNTNTNPGIEPDAIPVYLLDGITLVNSDHRDIWGSGIVNPINVDETGTQLLQAGEFSVDDQAWTGTDPDGTAAANPVGIHSGVTSAFNYEPNRGDSFQTQGGNATWLFNTKLDNVPVDTELRFYALSGILTVATDPNPVPAPGGLLVFIFAILGLAIGTRTRSK
jgi:hypothetical protein